MVGLPAGKPANLKVCHGFAFFGVRRLDAAFFLCFFLTDTDFGKDLGGPGSRAGWRRG